MVGALSLADGDLADAYDFSISSCRPETRAGSFEVTTRPRRPVLHRKTAGKARATAGRQWAVALLVRLRPPPGRTGWRPLPGPVRGSFPWCRIPGRRRFPGCLRTGKRFMSSRTTSGRRFPAEGIGTRGRGPLLAASPRGGVGDGHGPARQRFGHAPPEGLLAGRFRGLHQRAAGAGGSTGRTRAVRGPSEVGRRRPTTTGDDRVPAARWRGATRRRTPPQGRFSRPASPARSG